MSRVRLGGTCSGVRKGPVWNVRACLYGHKKIALVDLCVYVSRYARVSLCICMRTRLCVACKNSAELAIDRKEEKVVAKDGRLRGEYIFVSKKKRRKRESES